MTKLLYSLLKKFQTLLKTMSSKSSEHPAENIQATVHMDFKGSNFGWNGINYLIELDDPVEINVGGQTVEVDYFVASNIIKDDRQQTIIFPTNDMYKPLKHHGVVGDKGWTIQKAINAFKEWHNLPEQQRASKEITPLSSL